MLYQLYHPLKMPGSGSHKRNMNAWLEICHFILLASTLLYVFSLNEKITLFLFSFTCCASYRKMPWWYVQIRYNVHLHYGSISVDLFQQSKTFIFICYYCFKVLFQVYAQTQSVLVEVFGVFVIISMPKDHCVVVNLAGALDQKWIKSFST